jgi:hypothetical protein
LMSFKVCTLYFNVSLAIAWWLFGFLPLGKNADFPHKTLENSHLTDTDNTKRNDLTGVDSGNKHTLQRDQDG